MSTILKNVLLVDDNKIDNFFHERVIRKFNPDVNITALTSASAALDYLQEQTECPDIIFLDINMPGMTGWDFLEEFKKIAHSYCGVMIVVMLTTSENPDDKARALTHGILTDFRSKPLTNEMLQEIMTIFCNNS